MGGGLPLLFCSGQNSTSKDSSKPHVRLLDGHASSAHTALKSGVMGFQGKFSLSEPPLDLRRPPPRQPHSYPHHCVLCPAGRLSTSPPVEVASIWAPFSGWKWLCLPSLRGTDLQSLFPVPTSVLGSQQPSVQSFKENSLFLQELCILKGWEHQHLGQILEVCHISPSLCQRHPF